MGAGHSHSHGQASGNEARLWLALGLTGGFMVAELVGGLISGSLALISDAVHMFTDTAALAIALAAVRVARRPADPRRTFGYYRFEIIAAAVNALLLLGAGVYILLEAYQRLREPVDVETGTMLGIAVAGLVVNLVSMLVLRSRAASSLNMKAAYLEVWSDALGSVGVLLGALMIGATGWLWVDPVIAVAIGLWVMPRGWALLKESANILLEGVPAGTDVEKIRATLLAVPGVRSVHDVHVWALASSRVSLTAHVLHDPEYPAQALLERLRERMRQEFDISHTTFQLELIDCEAAGPVCTGGDAAHGHEDHHGHAH